MTTSTKTEDTTTLDIERIFHLQKENQYEVAHLGAKERIAKLNRLLDAVMSYRPQIKEAMYADFKKPPFEVDAVEIFPITGAIKHTRSHLHRWIKPQRVPTPLAFLGSTSWIHYEPKGVCLIISPWNFPFNLTFVPLVSAIAAGNCAMLKPSEMTPHSSALMKKMVGELFDESEVAFFEGGVEVSQALLQLPFNHIFFTGAPAIGKIVMEAAAKNLSSVTLELGGKSPTIIDETADIPTAAARIAFAKWANCGQICTGCDYLLVHESKQQQLLDELSKCIREFYGKDPSRSDSYPRMAHERQFDRVAGYLKDAVANGAKMVIGGALDASQNYIEPTILADAPVRSMVMKEEIFGPLLPVNAYRDVQEAIDVINAGERPLTMNIFSKNRKTVERIIRDTRSGGVTINNATMHFYNHDLPFGGVNNSGIGKSHGWHGFQDFSNARAIFRQNLPGAMDLLKPPYNAWKEKVIAWTIKWL
jgi:aldehyde dehydrogenase (NAD+)